MESKSGKILHALTVLVAIFALVMVGLLYFEVKHLRADVARLSKAVTKTDDHVGDVYFLTKLELERIEFNIKMLSTDLRYR